MIDGARNSARSSSEPKRASAGVAMSVCTPIAIGMPPQCDGAERFRNDDRIGVVEAHAAVFDRLVNAEKAEVAELLEQLVDRKGLAFSH